MGRSIANQRKILGIGILWVVTTLGCTPPLLPREVGVLEEKGETPSQGEEERIQNFFLKVNRSLDPGLARLYARFVLEGSQLYDLDPLLVASVIATESRVVARAVSPKGAVGLMQILPSVGEEIARATNTPWEGWTTLLDPRTNILLGCAYLRALLDRYEGDIPSALAAYNIGPFLFEEKFLKGGTPGSRAWNPGPYVKGVREYYLKFRRDELYAQHLKVRLGEEGL